MLKALIFDMDGVLMDSEPYHYRIEGTIYEELGISIPEEIRVTFVGLGNHKMWTFIKDKYQLPQTVEYLILYNEKRRAEYMRTITDIMPNPGVVALLEMLKEKNIPMAIGSSSTRDVINILLEKSGLTHYFQKIISGDEVKQGKPEPDIFLEAARQLDVDPKDCIVIEDSTNGVKAAKAAGMKCIGYINLSSRGQSLQLADYITGDFNEVTWEKLLAIGC